MSGTRLVGNWLIGVGLGSTTLALLHRDFLGLGVPFLLTAAGLLFFAHRAQTSRLSVPKVAGVGHLGGGSIWRRNCS